MNNGRRKQIKLIIEKLEFALQELERIRDDEQNYLDNIPENFRDSDKMLNSEEAVEYLENAIDNLSDPLENLKNIA